ncbi:MAG: cytochrome c, partial [Acetobacteraceae bacterium]|nr:cytochrome c [Acetobacteraceae bacterium]
AIRPRTIHAMERMLAGPPPQGSFGGLRAPAWPEEVLGAIDRGLAARGEALYAANCQGCHLPSPRSEAFWDARLWAPIGGGQRVLKLKLIPIAHVGTDPAQAADMKAREVRPLPELGLRNTNFGPALGELVANTVKAWYGAQTPPLSAAQRAEMDGYRGNGIRAELAYKARPLNGIWATGPFLHNGSVPTLYALLSPLAERPVLFHLGSREFDAVDVGYRTTPMAGDFLMDTRVRGNFNTGHVFDDLPRGNGVIGRRLSPEERRALVEFLKTL